MTEQEQANIRVLRWRSEGMLARSSQAGVLAILCWLLTTHVSALVWLVAAIAVGFIDSYLCRRLLKNPGSRMLFAATWVGMAMSSGVFASVGLLILLHNTIVGLTAASLALCAAGLNNAVMTRGSKAFSLALAGPPSVVLVATPIAANALGLQLGAGEIAILCIGAVAYTVFIARLAATLHHEAETLQFALESQERQRDFARGARQKAEQEGHRWSLVFNQSPLAQVCFDASRMHALLRDGDSAVNLGERLAESFPAAGTAIDLLSLSDANEAALSLFGVARFDGKIEARHFGDMFYAGFREAVSGVSEQGVFPPFEARIVRGDGEPVNVRVHIRTAPDEDRPWGLCMATFVDMTEVSRAAEAQREAVKAAQAANQAKSDFLAIMSHEIRTPLNGILGMAQAIVNDRLSPTQRARIEVVRTSGQALLAILNDVLDLSKIEAGKLELETAPFDLADLAQGARTAFESVASQKGLTFGLNIDDDARGVFEGDVVRIRQILLNLISNAVKFTAVGSVTLAITRTTGGVRFAVTDSGAGIAPERVGRLFEKFMQEDASTSRRFGGTGLGLSISRELCHAMGGVINVDSVLGEGSTFTVDLPLPRLSDAQAGATIADAETSRSAERPLRLLAAEDNAVNQLVLKTLLEQAGIHPTIVSDGAAAVAAWETEDWDVILMDVQMPVMDGPTASRRIRELEAATGRLRTPIIALTANAMSHQMEAYRAAGMDGFVAKPIEIARLYDAISLAVDEASPVEPESDAAVA